MSERDDLTRLLLHAHPLVSTRIASELADAVIAAGYIPSTRLVVDREALIRVLREIETVACSKDRPVIQAGCAYALGALGELASIGPGGTVEDIADALVRQDTPPQAAELWSEAEHCWTGTGCIHDDEAGCADAFWALTKRLKSEAFRTPALAPSDPATDTGGEGHG